jgi:hypothetical protein
MGCDIHLYIEVLTENGWELYSHPHIKRDYELFAKMAGVRNYLGSIEPIAEPRGLPNDISYLVRKSAEYWDSGGHSHSWLSSKEISELELWHDTGRDGRLANSKSLYHYILNSYCEGNNFDGKSVDWIKDARFVFWFDN